MWLIRGGGEEELASLLIFIMKLVNLIYHIKMHNN